MIANLVRPGKAKLDLRLWAILGPNSEAAHRAGYAAMQQNKLWLYATIVYLQPGRRAAELVHRRLRARRRQSRPASTCKKFDADRKSDAADQMIARGRTPRRQAQGFTGTPTIGVAKSGAQAGVLQRRADAPPTSQTAVPPRVTRGACRRSASRRGRIALIGARRCWPRPSARSSRTSAPAARCRPARSAAAGAPPCSTAATPSWPAIPVSTLGMLGGLALFALDVPAPGRPDPW